MFSKKKKKHFKNIRSDQAQHFVVAWPQGYKTFFRLNSTEHEISTAHKTKIQTNEEVSCLRSIRCCIYHANKC